MIKCFVIDDEPPALELVSGYAQQVPFLELCGKYTNPLLALQDIGTQKIDLLFLDINMPDLSGLELSRLIDKRVKVVFTTAYEMFALESYRVDALDYLLKPFSFEQFLRSAQKARDYFELQNRKNKGPHGMDDFIFVKSNYRIHKVCFNQIQFVENSRDYVKIYLDDGTNLMCLMSLKSMEEALPMNQFLKVHRSFIVNLDKIEIVERGQIVFGKHIIPVSTAYKDRFQLFLDKSLM